MGIQTPNVSHGEPVFITLCYLQVYKLLKGESINHIPKYSRLKCPTTRKKFFHSLFSKFSWS